MKMKLLSTIFTVVVLIGLAGCSSPETRIQRNPEAFARLSPEQQELVKQGKVAIGFDAEAVRLAVGDPDRTWTRTDAEGQSEIWTYTTYEDGAGHPLYTGWYHRYHYPSAGYYLNTPSRETREYYKVTFREGRVTTVEQETR